ncbi:MAG: hypothetical protein ABI036_11065 [Fibrobacteria bacterium]
MLVDELWFHRRRGLPAWERWGHPLDTLTVLACYALALALPPTRNGLLLYAGAAIVSTLFITKDEWVHARHCGGGESWLHACLFSLHPVLLAIAGAWRFLPSPGPGLGPGTDHAFFGDFLVIQAALTGAFLCYQLLYWNGPWKTQPTA